MCVKKRALHQAIGDRIRARRSIYTLTRRGRTYHRSSSLTVPSTPLLGTYYNEQLRRRTINVPTELDLKAHRDETLQLAEACRHAVFISKTPIALDFRATKKISAAAMLYLVAEIYRCLNLTSRHLLTGTYPLDKVLHRQMQDCGFFELLKVKNKLPNSPKTFPLEYIKVMSGVGADGMLADELQRMLLGSNMESKAYGAFYRSISEAMTNVAQHADPIKPEATKYTRMPKRWWMLGHVNKLRKELKVMIVDQGIGIPRSLPMRYPSEFIKSIISKLGFLEPTDGEMIEAAMQIGRTKTYRPHQGLGLNDLKRFIDTARAGSLRILSNRGEYTYTYSSGATVAAHTASIKGTLIEWTVPLATITALAAEQT